MNYSFVVPIFNDAYLAAPLCEEIERVFSEECAEFELLFINDGSTAPGTLEALVDLTERHKFVRVLDLSRNFGQHLALACGFREARGDIVIRMNVDMQDPPSALPKFIEAINADDADLVIGTYAIRRSPLSNKVTSFVYFWLFRMLTGMNVPTNTSPMRAMSRRFIDAYNQLTEKSRFPQGLDHWLGFRAHYIQIEHRERADKKSSYNFLSRLGLALTGVLYFSDRPIIIVVGLGALAALIGFSVGIYILLLQLSGANFVPGYATTAVLGFATFGIQMMAIGIVGLYVGRIFQEVQNRPLYLVRKTYGPRQDT